MTYKLGGHMYEHMFLWKRIESKMIVVFGNGNSVKIKNDSRLVIEVKINYLFETLKNTFVVLSFQLFSYNITFEFRKNNV